MLKQLSFSHSSHAQTDTNVSDNNFKIVSLFSGCGGLDLGFEESGFDIIWANEYDKDIWETYKRNHLNTELDRRSITNISENEIPECDGIIGGPPCQSWSYGGSKRGIQDKRGQLFYDYIRILQTKQPLFFLAENVSGMLLDRHQEALESIKTMFEETGYDLSFHAVNASDYGVPQDRKRVFFIGFRKDLKIKFKFPQPTTFKNKVKLIDAIGDIALSPLPISNGIVTKSREIKFANHEYMIGGFSSIYMSRNRVRSWDEVSFTIQAQARQAPMHPQAPKMELVSENHRKFVEGSEHLYRRLSVRECARIQTFPDSFILHYNNVAHGYKMIGNAVPVNLARIVAEAIKKNLMPLQDSVTRKNSYAHTS